MIITSRLASLKEHFSLYRWVTIDLVGSEIHQARNELEQGLRRVTRQPSINLEQYREFVADEDEHMRTHVPMAEFFVAGSFGPPVAADQQDVLHALIGPDVNVQAAP